MALRVGSHTFPRVAAAALALTSLLLALSALLGASGAAAAARAKPPEITSVKPSLAVVGDRLTIRGRNFRRGKGRNTVVFKRDGGRALFVKADISTSKLMRVVVPSRLEGLLPVEDGIRQHSRFRVRILSARLGRSFTPLARSPRIGIVAAGDADCDADGRINRIDAITTTTC